MNLTNILQQNYGHIPEFMMASLVAEGEVNYQL